MVKLSRVKKVDDVFAVTIIEIGKTVLIYGASGGVGLYANQLAKAHGTFVTAVWSICNVEVAKSVGADFELIIKKTILLK